MIEDLKKNYFRKRRKTVLSCIIATSIAFTNGVIAKAIEINETSNIINNKVKSNNDLRVNIGDSIELYDYLTKAEDKLHFKFKLPEYLPEGYKIGKLELKNISEKDELIEILFENEGKSFSFQVSEEDPAETIKRIVSEQNKDTKDLKIESEKSPFKLGEINGLIIKITTTLPESKAVTNYFAWKDSGLYYSIKFNSVVQSEEKSTELTNLSQDTVEKIVKSIKYT